MTPPRPSNRPRPAGPVPRPPRRPLRAAARAAALLLALLAPPFLSAQGASEPVVRQTFLPADFTRFAPRTALDMARQVPGFRIDEGGGDRGFGQADTNILVNGRRISGKSNGPVDALGRIPADDVVRLEVVDGASLDIGGLSGQVLNVVTASGDGVSGRFRFSPQSRTDGVPFRWRDGEIALSGGGFSSEWTLSVANDELKTGAAGPELVFDGAGAPVDSRQESFEEAYDQPGIAGSYTRISTGGGVLNLTGEFNGFIYEFDETSRRNPVGDVARVRTFRSTEDEFNFELGADYEFGLAGGRLKLIALHRFEESPTEAQTRSEFADGRPPTGSLFARQADEAETVVRAEYTRAALGGDWQWSLEGTHNFLDIESELSVRDDSGELAAVDFPGANARVEEDRAEFTVSYGRSLTDAVQLQASAGAEFSEIRQSGESGQTRDFVRPKGFVSLNWSASPKLDMAVQLERKVGQLNFFDTIAFVNVNEDRVNVTNADLVPPQSWLLDLQLQRSLDSYGSLTVGAFFEDISDIVDQIPIDGGGEAPGNIDSAERWGLSASLTLLFDPVGWKGARLDLDAEYVDSSVVDPLLGDRRRISDDDDQEYELTLRQDFPGTSWAAGLEVSYEQDSPFVRVDEVSLFRNDAAFTRLFIENKDVFGLTLRLNVSNLNDRSSDFSRTGFNDRLLNDIAFREERFRESGVVFSLDIEGSF